MSDFSPRHALGFDETNLVDVPECEPHRLTPSTLKAWLKLQEDARAHGFKPVVVSSYRGFDRQLAIWAGKATGKRPVLDDEDQLVDMASLSPLQKIEAIMRFSALPGSSRHHWGTDFDIADLSCVEQGYQVQLTVSETEGVMAPFYLWLDSYLEKMPNHFFRPYAADAGGVSIEPWHLSYLPEAKLATTYSSYEGLLGFYKEVAAGDNQAVQEILAKLELDSMPLIETVIQHFDAIYYRFIAQETP